MCIHFLANPKNSNLIEKLLKKGILLACCLGARRMILSISVLNRIKEMVQVSTNFINRKARLKRMCVIE